MSKCPLDRDAELPWDDPEWRVTHRFVAKTRYDAQTGCVLWMGGCDQKGYGVFAWGGKDRRAHTVAYEWFLGAPLHVGSLVHHALCGCHQQWYREHRDALRQWQRAYRHRRRQETRQGESL
jgi:hypothetical protein